MRNPRMETHMTTRTPLSPFRHTALALIAAAGLQACSTLPVLSSSQLDAREVRSLVAGNTITAHNLDTGTRSTAYYSPDGRVTQTRNGKLRRGTWSVKDDGRMCMEMASNKPSCRILRRDAQGVVRKYRPDNLFTPIIAYERIERGNLLGAAGSTRGNPDSLSTQEIEARRKLAEVQRRLRAAGYSPGVVDGIWGARSREALTRFQADRGLPATGEPDARTLAQLPDA